MSVYTVPLYMKNIFISRSCLTLVLTTVMSLPRHTDPKKGVQSYEGPTTGRENAIRKYINLLFMETKLHIRKCNTCRYIEKQSS